MTTTSGELREYGAAVFMLCVGQIVDADGNPVYRSPIASDAVVVDLNYSTGRAWLEPVSLA